MPARDYKRPDKVRITTSLDEDILDELKRIAKERYGRDQGRGKRQGYQTVLNDLLRDVLISSTENGGIVPEKRARKRRVKR